jgi:hypothetical protein
MHLFLGERPVLQEVGSEGLDAGPDPLVLQDVARAEQTVLIQGLDLLLASAQKAHRAPAQVGLRNV